MDAWLRDAGAGLLFVLLLSGCGLFEANGLDLVADHRLSFDTPKPRTLVTNPLTVVWTLSVRPRAGYFAIFVDRPPVHPGQSLKAVAAGDTYCQHTQGCPDGAYLAQRGVYTTETNSVTIPEISDIGSNTDRVQVHTVVVVLMSAQGRRVGESAWRLEVRKRRVGVA